MSFLRGIFIFRSKWGFDVSLFFSSVAKATTVGI